MGDFPTRHQLVCVGLRLPSSILAYFAHLGPIHIISSIQFVCVEGSSTRAEENIIFQHVSET